MLSVDWKAASATAELFLKSILMGIDHAIPANADFAEKIPVEILPYEEALKYMRGRLPMSAEEYYALDDKMRYRAFAVSRLADADSVKQVQDFLARSIDEGSTLADFRKMTNEELLDAAGLGDKSGGYWETVWRTNMQTAYNTGRAIGFSAVNPIALELVGVEDTRQTETCRSLTVPPFRRPYGDPVWETLWPPFHFRCRTTVRGIYDEKEIEDEGGPERFYTSRDPDGPGDGWGTNPLDGTDWWEMTPAMTKRAKDAGISAEIAEAKKALIRPFGAIKYRESATIQEANKFARSDLGLLGSNYSGCHVDAANEWNLSLTKNLNAFPEVNGLKFVGSFKEARKKYVEKATPMILSRLKAQCPGIPEATLSAAARKTAIRLSKEIYSAGAHGLSFFGEVEELQGIVLNDALAKDPAMHRMIRAREVKEGYKVVGGEKIGAIADHEFGHILDRWLSISDDKDIQALYESLVANEGGKRLSIYGCTTIHEMIAESWAEYRNNPTPREVASSVAEIILRRYGEWKKQSS